MEPRRLVFTPLFRCLTSALFSQVDQKTYQSTGDYLAKDKGSIFTEEKRLIIKGDWLGCRMRSNYAQLTRILVDLDNTNDEAFKITIDKTRAQLPKLLQPLFQSIAENAITESGKTMVDIGRRRPKRPQTTAQTSRVWTLTSHAQARNNPIKINRDNPLIESLRGKVVEIDSLLTLLEASLPVGLIQDRIHQKQTVSVSTSDQTELQQELTQLLSLLATQNITKEDAKAMLLTCEKYSEFTDQVNDEANKVFGD